MNELIVLGPLSHDAVTHLLPRQVLEAFDIRYDTLRGWKELHAFPRPVIVAGGAYYPRAQIDVWKKSNDAPLWLRGKARRPVSVREKAAAEAA